MKLQNLVHIAPRRIRDIKGIHMMTHHWSRKLCTTLIAICCFAAFPSKSDAAPRYFTAKYSSSYNKSQYYYSLWSVYGYDYSATVLGYAKPYYYMYLSAYKADYWITRFAQPAYFSNAENLVTVYAGRDSLGYARSAQYYWTHY